jgi:hypothetical protein
VPPWLRAAAALGFVIAAVIALGLRIGAGRPHHHPPAHPRPPAVQFLQQTRPILGIQAGWQLFALGPHDLVDVQFADGTITDTTVPPLLSDNPGVSLVVGRSAVAIRSFDFVPGYEVPDGLPARPLTGTMTADGPLLPGPAPGEAWQFASPARTSAFVLVTLAGRRLGPSIDLRRDDSLPATATPDGRNGFLLLTSTGGQVDVGPHSVRRISGQVDAVGPHTWLMASCMRTASCRDLVVNPASGAERVLPRTPVAGTSMWPPGVISRDGSTAAFVNQTSPSPSLYLISLATGRRTQVRVPARNLQGSEFMTWSPDGRWLFVAAGRLFAVNARTGRAFSLGVRLPPVAEVAIRPAPAAVAGAPNTAMTGGGRSGMDPAMTMPLPLP